MLVKRAAKGFASLRSWPRCGIANTISLSYESITMTETIDSEPIWPEHIQNRETYVMKLVEAGRHSLQIAEELNIDPLEVQFYIRKHHRPLRKRVSLWKVHKLRKEGLTNVAIALHLKCSAGTVSQVLSRDRAKRRARLAAE